MSVKGLKMESLGGCSRRESIDCPHVEHQSEPCHGECRTMYKIRGRNQKCIVARSTLGLVFVGPLARVACMPISTQSFR